MIIAFLAAEAFWIGGGLASLLAGRSSRWATLLGTGSVVMGCAFALIPTLATLGSGHGEKLAVSWGFPGLALSLGFDPLSAFFLLPILILATTTAIYGGEYMLAFRKERNLGRHWFLFNLLVAGMSLAVTARNAILFLIAWEVMTLSAAFLVMFEDQKKEVRYAGWLYLVATHIGTAFLLPFFALLASHAGSMEFDAFAFHRADLSMGFLFLLGLVGFGAKAGMMPFHIWLPEAHPAAPSHVSALMSGVILNTGVYGLLRGLTFLGGFQEWWGWTLMGAGLVSALLGILFALAQHDLKRMLAYSSVENIGIIYIGMGMGVLGANRGSPVLATLGFCGALLHVLNHSMAKGMLFLNAGAVLHATGTRRLNLLGGLFKKMPWEGSLFLVGSVALCALPPLNGFLSEFWIYLGAFHFRNVLGPGAMLPGMSLFVGLALVGGLAAVSFTKAFGSTYLGNAKHEPRQAFHPPGWAMKLPMLALAAICLMLVPLLPWIAGLTAPMVQAISGLDLQAIQDQIAIVQTSLWPISIFAGLLFGLVGLLALIRLGLLRRRKISEAVTWDCGYAEPSRRMQYTGTSYSQPVVGFFHAVLQTLRTEERTDGLFPKVVSRSSSVPDLALEKIYRPLFYWINNRLARWRWIQHGRIQAYILYISVTLIILLTWKLR